MSSTARTVGGASALVGALAWLHALGDRLPPPPWSDPAAVTGWADSLGVGVAAFAVLRQAAIALAAYLLIVTLLGWAVRALGLIRAQGVLDRVTVAAVRRLVG